MKPMLSFTAHVAPKAVQGRRRRRKPVKTPANPRVRCVQLGGGEREQDGAGLRHGVKWVRRWHDFLDPRELKVALE